MTIVSYDNLRARALQIRQETAGFANDETRVGSLFQDLVDTLSGNLGSLSIQGFGALTTNTGALNDAAISAAVTAAIAANASLYWQPGTYVSAASIPNFHSVRHWGPGAIQRGSDVFYVQPKSSQTNVLYVNGTGSAANDGLSSAQPMAEPQNAFNAMANYGPVLNGLWRIQQAAGTLTNKPVSVNGLQSTKRIEWLGPTVAYGVPTAIMDGTGASADGANFQTGMFIYVKDIKFQNFTGANLSGLVCINRCDMWADNVHVNNCNFTGISCTAGIMYVGGGIINQCTYGVQAYSQTAFNFGYGGHPTTATNCTTAGFNIRDSSSGDVIGCVATGNLYGARLLHQSRAKFNGCTITGNTGGVFSEIFCTVQDEAGNTLNTNPNGNWINHWSVDLGGEAEYNYDQVNKRHGWGVVTPGVKYHFKAGTSGATLTSTSQFIYEDTSPQLAFSGDGTGLSGIIVSTPTQAIEAGFRYNASTKEWIFRHNNADTQKVSSNRRYWTATVFDMVGTGTPLGVVVADIGSTFRRTDGGAGTSFYVKEANNGANTGWVGK